MANNNIHQMLGLYIKIHECDKKLLFIFKWFVFAQLLGLVRFNFNFIFCLFILIIPGS